MLAALLQSSDRRPATGGLAARGRGRSSREQAGRAQGSAPSKGSRAASLLGGMTGRSGGRPDGRTAPVGGLDGDGRMPDEDWGLGSRLRVA